MRFFTFFILFLAFVSSRGQNFLGWKFQDRYFSLSVGTGSATYFGELNHSYFPNKDISVINTGIEARLLSRFSARISGNYYKIDGADKNAPDSSLYRQRNLSFKSKNFQFGLDIIYYFKGYQGDFYKRWKFDPYVYVGAGLTHYNPATEFSGQTVLLRELETEGEEYGSWAGAFPLGLGGKFRVNDFVNINLEASYFYTTTDYLDDVSKNYTTTPQNILTEALSNRKDEVGVIKKEFYDQQVAGAKRGNPKFNDSLLLLMLKVEVYLPNSFKKH